VSWGASLAHPASANASAAPAMGRTRRTDRRPFTVGTFLTVSKLISLRLMTQGTTISIELPSTPGTVKV
jgi:hypothetical protein